MNILEFTYTTDTKTSDRFFIPLTIPSKSYFGIDVTELDIEDQVMLSMELDKIMSEKDMRIKELMDSFDISFSYRTFMEEKMSNIKEHKD